MSNQEKKPLRVLVAEACKVWASQFKNQPAELNYNRSRNGAYTGDHPYPTVKAVTPIGDPGPPKPPAKRKDPEKK